MTRCHPDVIEPESCPNAAFLTALPLSHHWFAWAPRNSSAEFQLLKCHKWLAMPDNRTFLGLHFVIAKCKTFFNPYECISPARGYYRSSICKLVFSHVSNRRVSCGIHRSGLNCCCSLNARQHIRNGKQHNSSSDRPLPIIFSEDWENAPEALRPQHGFAVSTVAIVTVEW